MPESKTPSTHRTDLISILRELPDPRVERTKLHKFEDLLLISICSLLCGAESFEDMELFGDAKEPWLRTFLELPHGIPSHDTFNRLFAALDPQRFLEAFMRWTQSLRTALSEEVVAIDGKALRSAIAAGQNPKVVVSAWAGSPALQPPLFPAASSAGNGLVLGQRRVEDKSNEIAAVPELLRTLELAGCTHSASLRATLDAMGCQRRIAREIKEADAEYVLALNGKTSTERRYYLSSLELDAEKFARAVRSHWGIENQLHWVLGVVFGEDQSSARAGHAAENLATLRRWALNLLKADTRKARRSIKGRIKAAGWDRNYLLHLLALNPNLDA